MHTHWFLIGCGYLGGQLLPTLTAPDRVTVTTTRQSKAAALRSQNVHTLIWRKGENLQHLSGVIRTASGRKTALVNIPPGRPLLSAKAHYKPMIQLVDQLFASGLDRLIFISTTAVYGDSQTTSICTAQTPCKPTTQSGIAHCLIEEHLQLNYPQQAQILRLAGIVGPGRHPINSLSGKSLTDGQRRVNLVHTQDIVRAIHRISELDIVGEHPLHLAATAHPSRENYYCWAAKQKGLAEPYFTSPCTQLGKIVDATSTLAQLKLRLRFPSPYDMV